MKLSRYQITLRGIAIAVTVLCIGPLPWLAHVRQRAMVQNSAIREISAYGGQFYWEDNSADLTLVIGAWPESGRANPVDLAWQINTTNASSNLRRVSDLQELLNLHLTSTRATVVELGDVDGLPFLHRLYINDLVIRYHNLTKPMHLPKLTDVDLSGSTFDESVLVALLSLDSIESISLRQTDLCGKSLDVCSGLKDLHMLDLSYSNISDTEIARLRCAHLKELWLDGTDVSESSLEVSQDMPDLVVLSLRGTTIGDAGVHRLCRLRHLRRLGLANTCVTDACLQDIGTITSLEEIDVKGTSISMKGINELQKRLPNARVLY